MENRLKKIIKKIKKNIFYRFSKIKKYSNAKDWLLENNLMSNYVKMIDNERIDFIPGKHVENEPWDAHSFGSCFLNEVFLVSLPNASYIPKWSSYVTRDNILLNDLSLEFGEPQDLEGFNHSVFHNKLPKETYIDKTVAVLDSAGAQNYFHWFINILPKIEFFEKSGIDIDHYLVDVSKPFQKASLEMINFPMDKIIPLSSVDNIKAKNIIASNLPSSPGITNSSSIEFLRNKFEKKQNDRNLKIFISRKKALQGRTITNEDEVFELIEKYGFESYVLEDMSFYDQVEIFSKAKIVLAPHGAGLTNMIFCPDDTKIIECCNPKYRATCYYILAGMCNFDYYYILGDGDRPSLDQVTYDCSGNITVDLKKLETILNMATNSLLGTKKE